MSIFQKFQIFKLSTIFLFSHLMTYSRILIADSSMAQFLASQQLIESGQKSFLKNCMGCHGVEAKGDGVASVMLKPKPRNLVSGSFKFRSTSLGEYPTTNDLLRVIDQGVLGTSMPGFPLLSSSEKYALVAYVKSLRKDWPLKDPATLKIPMAPQEIFTNKTLFLASAF